MPQAAALPGVLATPRAQGLTAAPTQHNAAPGSVGSFALLAGLGLLGPGAGLDLSVPPATLGEGQAVIKAATKRAQDQRDTGGGLAAIAEPPPPQAAPTAEPVLIQAVPAAPPVLIQAAPAAPQAEAAPPVPPQAEAAPEAAAVAVPANPLLPTLPKAGQGEDGAQEPPARPRVPTQAAQQDPAAQAAPAPESHKDAPKVGTGPASAGALRAIDGPGPADDALPTVGSATTPVASPAAPGGLTPATQGQAAAHTHGAQAQNGASTAPTHGAVQAVAIALQKAAEGGESRRFVLQLDPPELGRVEVRMEFGRDKTVKAIVLVDKADTYALLQRDAGALERSLQGTGLDTGAGLQFSLAQGGQKGAEEQGGSGKGLSSEPEEIGATESAMLHWVNEDTCNVVV